MKLKELIPLVHDEQRVCIQREMGSTIVADPGVIEEDYKYLLDADIAQIYADRDAASTLIEIIVTGEREEDVK